MSRSDLECWSREELIELVLRLQRPEKTSRTSSKPPATDRKERREQSKPGCVKPGHEGHSCVMSDAPDMVVEHRPDRCACCGGTLHGDLAAEIVSVSEQIDLPVVAPVVIQHRRLAVHCPSCGTKAVAPVPEATQRFASYAIGYVHIDIAEVSTAEGKLRLFVAIDRTSKFAFVRLVESAGKMEAAQFLRDFIEAVPYHIHTVLTDNGLQFMSRRRDIYDSQHIFDRVCDEHGIEHRLTKVNQP